MTRMFNATMARCGRSKSHVRSAHSAAVPAVSTQSCSCTTSQTSAAAWNAIRMMKQPSTRSGQPDRVHSVTTPIRMIATLTTTSLRAASHAARVIEPPW